MGSTIWRSRRGLVLLAGVTVLALTGCVPTLPPPPTPTSSTTTTSTTTTSTTTTSTTTTSTTTTTTPAGTPMGWQLTESNTGLVPHGLGCDTLPLYTPTSYNLPSGTVISGQRIETEINLSAGNILIENSCIRPEPPGFGFARGDNVVMAAGPVGCSGPSCATAQSTVTIRDSEIDGSRFDNEAVSNGCAFAGIANLQRNYMHDTGSGICFNQSGDHVSAVVEGNVVTRLRAFGDAGTTGSHNESMTVRDFDTRVHPERRLTVRNNRFVAESGNDTGAFFIQAQAGYIDQVLIQNNLLEGNGYSMPLEFNSNGYGTNMRAINNRFRPLGFGPGYVDGGPGWAEWRDNHIYDATAPDGKGPVVPIPLP